MAESYRCKFPDCESDPFASLAGVRAHYTRDHPGQKSPQPRRSRSKKRNRPAAPSVPTIPAAGPEPSGPTTPGPEGPPLDEGPVEVGPDVPDAERDELAPVGPTRRSWRERLGLKSRDVPRETSRPRSRPAKREDATDVLQWAWGGLGAGLIRTGIDRPVGRCMQFQAPIAGVVLNDLFAGSPIDTMVLQPLAKNKDAAKAAGALFALPTLVFLHQRVPAEAIPMIESMMEDVAIAHLAAMVPVIKDKRAKDRELQKVIDDMHAEGMLDPSITNAHEAVESVLSMIFAEPAAAAPADEHDERQTA